MPWTRALPGPAEVPEVPAAGAGTEFSRALRRDWTDPQAPVAEGSAASVAIIMRTKDRPLLLERALDDVLAQTLADWRLVINGLVLVVASLYLPQGIVGALERWRRGPPPRRPVPASAELKEGTP